jgi:hypothetical protein
MPDLGRNLAFRRILTKLYRNVTELKYCITITHKGKLSIEKEILKDFISRRSLWDILIRTEFWLLNVTKACMTFPFAIFLVDNFQL